MQKQKERGTVRLVKKDFRANSVMRCPDLRDVRFNYLVTYQELCRQINLINAP